MSRKCKTLYGDMEGKTGTPKITSPATAMPSASSEVQLCEGTWLCLRLLKHRCNLGLCVNL